MADAFGVEREISKAKGKEAQFALRRLERVYGRRMRLKSAQVDPNPRAGGPNIVPPKGWNTTDARVPKKTRKAAKARWKAERKAAQQTQKTTQQSEKKDKTVKTDGLWKNPWVKGAAVAGGGAAAGGLGYTLYADSKKD